MNVFSFTGRLGRDAEQRYTTKGTAVLSFTVANDTGYGEKETTNWVQCAIFGKRAEGKLGEHLTKGAQVAVTGELTLNKYTKNDGTQDAALRCMVNDLTLVGGRTEHSEQPQQAKPQPAPSDDMDDFNDTIPF